MKRLSFLAGVAVGAGAVLAGVCYVIGGALRLAEYEAQFGPVGYHLTVDEAARLRAVLDS